MICPFCNAENPDGSRFCDVCEKPLTGKMPSDGAPQAENPSVGKEKKEERKEERKEEKKNWFTMDLGDIEKEARRRLAGMMNGGGETQEPSAAKQTLTRIVPGDSLEEISVQYAVNRIFLPGGQVHVEFQVHGNNASLLSVHACLSMTVAGKKLRQDGECRGEQGHFQGVFVCYLEKDSICGNVLVRCHLTCRWQDHLEFFDFDANHEILPKNLSAKEIHNNFTLTDGSLIKDANFQTYDNSDEFARRMNSQPPMYKLIKIFKSKWRPEEEICDDDYSRPEAMESMTLLFDHYAVYVSSKAVVRMGRRPSTNDFAVMDWKNNQCPDQSPTITVSRDQLELRNCGDCLLLYTEKETTLLDGISPDIGGAGGIILRESSRLSMGDISLRMRLHSCNMRRNTLLCKNCMARKMKSVTLAREDGLPEGFAIVWECCELGVLNPELEGFTLYCRNGGFLLYTPEHKLYNLVAGERFKASGKTVCVRHFVQRIIGSTHLE